MNPSLIAQKVAELPCCRVKTVENRVRGGVITYPKFNPYRKLRSFSTTELAKKLRKGSMPLNGLTEVKP